jgi:hypothetical protein
VNFCLSCIATGGGEEEKYEKLCKKKVRFVGKAIPRNVDANDRVKSGFVINFLHSIETHKLWKFSNLEKSKLFFSSFAKENLVENLEKISIKKVFSLKCLI